MKKLKFVIASPINYSGGVIVLHNLCRLLIQIGYDAKMIYFRNGELNPRKIKFFWLRWMIYNIRFSVNLYELKNMLKHLLNVIRGTDQDEKHSIPFHFKYRKFIPILSSNTIVVYPEIFFGNPLHSKKVVRWLLYYNSFFEFNNESTVGFDRNDLFFAYRDIFNDERLNPEKRILCTPFFDLDLYKRTNFGQRKGKCYILRKGAWRIKSEDCSDGIIIDDLSEPEKVKVFNQCEYCISYDTQTAYSRIAAICGCISIVVPEEGKEKKDYRSPSDNTDGIAFGFDKSEIDFAISTQSRAKKYYEDQNKDSLNQVKHFVEVCNEVFTR